MADIQSEAVRAKWDARNRVKRVIRSLSKEERVARSRSACESLCAVPELRAARAVLMYAALPDELDLWPALHSLKDDGKRVILPKCHPYKHEVMCIEIGDFKTDLIRGTFNILEPKSDVGISLDELDVVVAPGRAFDRQGNRVGRGAAYYDRFFVRDGFHAFICGVGFDCQMFPEVPIEPHDIPVHGIVTESGLLRTARPHSARPEQ